MIKYYLNENSITEIDKLNIPEHYYTYDEDD